jgi:hypothetical protein
MKFVSLFSFIASLWLTETVAAQERSSGAKNLGEVESKRPGILLAISRIERIEDNRLLVFVRVTATTRLRPQELFLV